MFVLQMIIIIIGCWQRHFTSYDIIELRHLKHLPVILSYMRPVFLSFSDADPCISASGSLFKCILIYSWVQKYNSKQTNASCEEYNINSRQAIKFEQYQLVATEVVTCWIEIFSHSETFALLNSLWLFDRSSFCSSRIVFQHSILISSVGHRHTSTHNSRIAGLNLRLEDCDCFARGFNF